MHKKKILILLFSVLLVACSTLSSEPTPEPTVLPSPTFPNTPTLTPEPTEIPTPVFSSTPYYDGMIARRNGDYARAIAAFQLALKSNPTPELLQETQYRLAEAYWLNDDARALNLLTTFLQTYPNGAHAPEAHMLLADSYRAKKDYANALEQLRIYRDQSPMLVGDTDATIADILVLAGTTTEAIAQYDRALQDTSMLASTRINVLRRASDLHAALGQPALAAARLDTAFAISGDARTKAELLWKAGEAYAVAKQIDKAMARWTDAINKYPDQPAAYQALIDLLNAGRTIDDYQRGLVDYYAAAYDPAIAAFERSAKVDAARAGDARYFIASSHSRKGEYSTAIVHFNTIINSMPNHKRVADAYFGKAAATNALGKADDAVAIYKKFQTTFPESDRADDALWSAALIYDRAKRYAEAAALYESVHTKYPSRERTAEALFWAGMDHYRLKDYKTASARWQSITKDYSKTTFYARALYWLGKSAQVRGVPADAKNYWTQASTLTGYYAWRAKDVLNPPKQNISYDLARYAMGSDAERAEFEKWILGWAKVTATGTLDTATKSDNNFKRGAELLRLDRTVEARRDFATLVEEKKNDVRALYALAIYFRDNNLYSLALDCGEKIARLANEAGAPVAPRYLWQLRYPTYYADLVVPESQKNNLDPLMYFALIRQESSFNPWSTSSADARGLGQVMPSTGQGIAKLLGVKNYSTEQLYLPYVSIRFGTWYLAQDMKNFGEPIYALAAYNAGTGRVQKWQRADLDLTVEEVDIRETISYISIVYSNWRQYQTVYTK
ncbi:MAG: tetratricopeptide repeat protein [Chloroflexi bacterium]|nr:tetratricopeptide repeat protein [Chloroflexota bacterium]